MTDADRNDLLALHDRDREAHLRGDAELLAAGVDEELLESSRGRLQRLSRDQFRERFAAYFDGVRYSRWDDVEPPSVEICTDGRTAWMVVHIEASVTDGVESRRFESSWIAVYRKTEEGAWAMTAIASSVLDVT